MPSLADEFEPPDPRVSEDTVEELGLKTSRISAYNGVFKACIKTDKGVSTPSNIYVRAVEKSDRRQLPFPLYDKDGKKALAWVEEDEPSNPKVYLDNNGLLKVSKSFKSSKPPELSESNAYRGVKISESSGTYFPLLEKKELDDPDAIFYTINWENLQKLIIDLFEEKVFELTNKEKSRLKFMIKHDFEPERLFKKVDGEIRYSLLSELIKFIRRQLGLYYRREDEKRSDLRNEILQRVNEEVEGTVDFQNSTFPAYLDRYQQDDIQLLRKMEIAASLRTQQLWRISPDTDVTREEAVEEALKSLEE